jgi:hypothetical protein
MSINNSENTIYIDFKIFCTHTIYVIVFFYWIFIIICMFNPSNKFPTVRFCIQFQRSICDKISLSWFEYDQGIEFNIVEQKKIHFGPE